MWVLLVCCVLWHADVGDAIGRGSMAFPAVGRIRGSTMKSRLGKDIYAFRGIRYGMPPIGERRFQAPEPEPDWENIFDATLEGPACPQKSTNFISEDCLRLNVYTTQLPTAARRISVKRPVIVYFHPSAFMNLSGQSFFFGPQYIMDKNLVLVTCNYRLGVFGFLAMGNAVAPGNMGLKDQVLALRWIQRNIVAFGGDPKNVIAVGSSAGGRITILHLVSPMSRNLIHKVISMSGAPMKLEPEPKDLMGLVKKQAALLDCPSYCTMELLSCFRTKTMQELLDTEDKFYEWHGNPVVTWSSVVEPDVPGFERFLPDQPINLITQGQFLEVPIVIGVTKDEFGCNAYSFLEDNERHGTMLRELNDDWYHLAPYCFLYDHTTGPESITISRSLRSFYFGNQPINETTIDGLEQLYADSITNYATHRTAKLLAEYSKEPVYFYKFTYQGRYSLTMWNKTTPYGVCHIDEQQYIFFSAELLPYLDKNAPETPMINRMLSIFENFAYTGQPIPEDNDMFANVVWERFDPKRDNYLKLSIDSVMETGFYPERMRKWEELSTYLANQEN